MKALAGCENLSYLSLGGLKGVYEDTFSHITGGKLQLNLYILIEKDSSNSFLDFKKVKILNLGNNPEANDFCLTKLVAACTKVENVNLSCCMGFKDANLAHILKNCKQLNKIILNNSPQLKEKPLRELQSQYPFVQIVREFRRYQKLKDDGLKVKLPHIKAKRPGVKKKKKR